MIKSLVLKKFKLFKKEEFTFNKINIIKGINSDDQENSSNGSGKSSILEGIIFALYGEGSGKNLQDLISFNQKEAEVILNLDNQIIITRSIPTDLIIKNGETFVEANTNTLKQNWLNEQIGSYDFFKKYRLINKQAVNLLDLGIISLRKELMAFIDLDFSSIRNNLLTQKLERENKNINKRLYHFYLSEKRLKTLEEGLKRLEEAGKEGIATENEQRKIVNQYKTEIQTKERLIVNRTKELEEVQKSGMCPILKKQCAEITKSLTKEQKENINREIDTWKKDIITAKENLQIDEDYLQDLELGREKYNYKIQRTQSYIMKLKEAFKFVEYKYTQKDVELHSASIKVLDDFAGWYIQNWLDNLSVIISDLLEKVNISVSFSADKQFMTVINENQSMKYESLSSGQQIFLNVIFKLAILLNNGTNSGILIIDEGIGNLDLINLHKLVVILKTLPFQVFLVYQNIDEIEETNIINIERKDNQSYKK